MSILRNFGTTGRELPGRVAQSNVDQQLQNTGAQFEFSPDIDTQLGTYTDWLTTPGNVPQYYSGETVAGLGPSLSTAHDRYRDVAGQTDTLTNQLVADYQSQLDPNSALNRQIADSAAQSAAGAYFGAGTPGSARGQYASALAAQDAVRAARERGLRGLGDQRGALTAGADILRGVGLEERGVAQDVIDEDIKRFNYAQLVPATIQEQLLGASALASDANTNINTTAGFEDLLPGSSRRLGFGDLYNQGGEVMDQGGILGDQPMPTGVIPMGLTPEVEMDELSMIEDTIRGMAAVTGADVSIKRISTKKKGK